MTKYVAMAGITSMALMLSTQRAFAQLEYIGLDENAGLAKAVIIPTKGMLFTGQLLPLDDNGDVVGVNDAGVQIKAELSELDRLLQSHEFNATLGDVARLNVYLANDSAVDDVRKEIRNSFPKGHLPSVTYVKTPVGKPDALVAIDAITLNRNRRDFRRGGAGKFRAHRINESPSTPADFSYVSGERLIFVSGQAEPGEFRESIRKTCDALARTIKWAGSSSDHVVQIKVFFESIDELSAVKEGIIASSLYDGRMLPPISFVQWTNKGPTEIEVIAGPSSENRDAARTESIEYLTPPWMTESPVYSKVTVTNSNRLIFTSGLYGKPNASSEEQVTSLFAELGQVAKDAGSDMRHLAKATYYITNDEVGSKLNSLRPKLYDPKRPPAASKATVQGVGAEGCSITLDMIAVPVAK